MTRPVFLATAGELDTAAPGGTVVLGGDEGRHAATVRRIRTGEEIDLVDGAGLRVTGTVADVSRDRLTVTASAVATDESPAVRLVLVQALAKGGRDEQAVEAATELGVDAIVPWQAARSVSLWRGAKAEKGRIRWQAIAASAAKQSRRARMPTVHEATGDLTAVVTAMLAGGGTVLVLHEEAAESLTAAPLPEAGEVAVVVGPEGGITDAELAALQQAGARAVLAGPHVLRTSTAGPAALAVLASRLGRWD